MGMFVGGSHPVLLEEEKKIAMINGDIKTTLQGLVKVQDVTRCIKDMQARNVDLTETDKRRLVHTAESILTSAKVAGIITTVMPSCARGKSPFELSNMWDLEVYTDSVTNEVTTMRSALRDILNQMFGLGVNYTRNRVNFARMSPDQKVFGMGLCVFLSAVINTPFNPKIYSAFHYRMREETSHAVADEFFHAYLKPILVPSVPAFESKSWTWAPPIAIGGPDVLSKLFLNVDGITATNCLFSNYIDGSQRNYQFREQVLRRPLWVCGVHGRLALSRTQQVRDDLQADCTIDHQDQWSEVYLSVFSSVCRYAL